MDRDIDSVKETIAANAERVRAMADSLTRAILTFEDQIAALPGRVACEWKRPTFTLSLRKDGKAWRLFADDKPLYETSLTRKIEACYMFTDLLTVMDSEQRQLIERMSAAKDAIPDLDKGSKT